MSRSVYVAVFPLLFAASSLLPSARHAVPPVPGPGAVVQVIEEFLTAVDAGDRTQLEQSFTPMDRGEGVDYAVDPATQKLTMRETRRGADGSRLLFQDAGVDGKPVTADSAAGVAETLLQKVGGADRELSHRIVSVNADCPGPGCSWGLVEFERTFRHEGQRMMVPMRATVLLRHRGKDGMRIFLWHAAPSGPAQMQKGGRAK